jgi:hypothetical protein
MKKLIIDLLLNFASMDFIKKIIAKGIAKLLESARKCGGDHWDSAKVCVKEIKLWCEIFDKVYEDDTLTEEEEIEIQEAIEKSNITQKIKDKLKTSE